MLQNLRLGVKIGGGFGVLIAISCILGGIAVFNMNAVKSESTSLAKAYVPEVGMANNVERHSLLTMYGMRGYGLSEDKTFLKEGQDHLAEVKKYLGNAKAHAQEFPELVKLREGVDKSQAKVAEYDALVQQTIALNNGIEVKRGEMDTAAPLYMKNCEEYLTSQNEAMKQEIAAGAPAAKLDERLKKISLVNEIINLGNDTRIKAFKSQAMRDPKIIEDGALNFEKMDKLFSELRNTTRKEENLRQIENTKNAATNYKNAMLGLLKNWMELQTVNKTRTVVGEEVLALAQSVANAGMEQTAQIADDAVTSLSSASIIMIAGLAIALALGILVAIVLTMAITKPVSLGVSFAEAMAQGDFTQTLKINQKDEIGVLANALNSMVQKLREIVAEVQTAAENVASGSEELSASAESLSQGATEQSASMEEMASSMEEMTSTIKQNASNATLTEEIATKAAREAAEGGKAVAQTVEAMKNIAGKITIIEEIARQTNLLALNAAIEAARAGEHGKGFAVVAAEVRKLAERSGQAAAEISELSGSSVEVAERAGNMLNKIVPDIQKNAALVQEIAAASNEQSNGADQIGKAIGQLDTVVQQNASASEEMASTSEELSSQAMQLQQSISFFRVETGAYSHAPRKVVAHKVAPKKLSTGSASSGKSHGSKGLAIDMNEAADADFERF